MSRRLRVFAGKIYVGNDNAERPAIIAAKTATAAARSLQVSLYEIRTYWRETRDPRLVAIAAQTPGRALVASAENSGEYTSLSPVD